MTWHSPPIVCVLQLLLVPGTSGDVHVQYVRGLAEVSDQIWPKSGRSLAAVHEVWPPRTQVWPNSPFLQPGNSLGIYGPYFPQRNTFLGRGSNRMFVCTSFPEPREVLGTWEESWELPARQTAFCVLLLSAFSVSRSFERLL